VTLPSHATRPLAAALCAGIFIVLSAPPSCAAEATGQTPAADSRPEAAGQGVDASQAAKDPTPARRQVPRRNVRVVVKLIDQIGDAAPVVRTVTMTIADGHKSSVRSETYLRLNTEVPAPPGAFAPSDQQVPLMVDATVELLEPEAVLLHLLFNYRIFGDSATGPDGVPVTRRDLSEVLRVLLKPGQPLVVSESADAISDRSVKVEVQADILP